MRIPYPSGLKGRARLCERSEAIQRHIKSETGAPPWIASLRSQGRRGSGRARRVGDGVARTRPH